MSDHSIEISIDSPPFITRNRNLIHEMGDIRYGIPDTRSRFSGKIPPEIVYLGDTLNKDLEEIENALQIFLFNSIDLNSFPITDFIDVRAVEFKHQFFELTSQISRKFCLSSDVITHIWSKFIKNDIRDNDWFSGNLNFGPTRSKFKLMNTNFLINDVTSGWGGYILFNDGIEYKLQNSSIFRSEESLFHSGSGKIFRAKFKVNVINPILIGIIDMNGMALKDPRYIEWNRTDKISKLDL